MRAGQLGSRVHLTHAPPRLKREAPFPYRFKCLIGWPLKHGSAEEFPPRLEVPCGVIAPLPDLRRGFGHLRKLWGCTLRCVGASVASKEAPVVSQHLSGISTSADEVP